jgi:uncharacterized protein (DUF433 family)/DNA-binding transcriptional MerR regulator
MGVPTIDAMAVETEGVIGVGLYSISEASRLTRTHRNTVSSWVRMGLVSPLYHVPGQPRLLSFQDLISLFVVHRLRGLNVPMKTIKRAEQQLAAEWGVEKPFASNRIVSAHGAVMTALREGEQIVALTGAFQEVFFDLIRKDLKDVTHDAQMRAKTWQPHSYVLLRPDVQFGAPCVDGTRITTKTIYGFIEAGENPQDIADDYGLTVKQITEVHQWEKSLGQAA